MPDSVPPSLWRALLSRELTVRRRRDEWMDAPGADPRQLRQSLRFLRRINWLLGYTQSTLRHLDRFSTTWQRDRPIRILDVATGSADLPRALLRWADARGWDLRVVGLDLHPTTAREGLSDGRSRRIAIVQGDAMALPFADGSFDYVFSSLFLHHLDERQIVQALREMNRVAGRGLIVGDLLRHRWAYAGITLLSLGANPMVRHDGRASVAGALSKAEALALRDQAGASYAGFHWDFSYRYVLAGEKNGKGGGMKAEG